MKKQTLKMSLLSMGLAAAGMLVVFFMAGIFPFGGNTVLTGDLSGLYLPFYSYVGDSFREGFSFFSFSKSLGGGVAGLAAYIPVSLYMLVTPLLSNVGFADFFAILLFLKLVFAAGLFSCYLCRKTGANVVSALLGFCYAFMAYNFIYAQNTMWLDNVLLLPLLLLLLDGLIERGNFLLFSAVLFLAILSNYYTAYMLCLFLVLYFFWQAVGEKRLKGRALLNRLIRFAGGGLLGAALSAFIMVPMALQTLANKGFAASGGGLFTFKLGDFFRQLVYTGFSWDQVENGPPLVYCGYLCLVLMIFYFISKRITLRNKLISGGFLLLLFLSFWLAPLNRVWHIFRDPVWFPYRFSFVAVAFFLILAAKAYEAANSGEKVERKGLHVWLLSVAVVVGVIAGSQLGILSVKMLLATAGLIAGVALLVSFLIRPMSEKSKKAVSILLLAFVFMEMSLNGGYITSQFELRDRAAFRETTENVDALLEAREKTGFYRTEKDFYLSLNDPLFFGYNGYNHFSSVADNASEDILEALGFSGIHKNPTFSTVAANALLSTKYLLSDNEFSAHDVYNFVAESGGYRLYENPYALPFAVKTARIDAAIAAGDAFATVNNIYSALAGRETLLFSEAAVTEKGAGNFAVENPEAGMYYAYLTAKTEGSALSVNGEDRGTVGFYNVSGIVPLTEVERGGKLEFSLNAYNIVVYRLDLSLFEEVVEELRATAPEKTAVDGGKIEITVDAKAGDVLFLSMPYYDSWKATVSGEDAALFSANGGFAAIALKEGENIIQLRYVPKGLYAGIAVSAIALIIFITLLILRRRKRGNEQRTNR